MQQVAIDVFMIHLKSEIVKKAYRSLVFFSQKTNREIYLAVDSELHMLVLFYAQPAHTGRLRDKPDS